MKDSKKPSRRHNQCTVRLAEILLGESAFDLPSWMFEERPRKFITALRILRDVRAKAWRS